jgi:hypothetical protein
MKLKRNECVKKEEIKRFFNHCPVQTRTKARMMVNRERRKEIEAEERRKTDFRSSAWNPLYST